MRAASRLLLALALALTLTALSGCGKKPKLLDPPEDAGPEAKSFPRIYPNAKYDPAAPSGGLEPMAPPSAYPPIIRPDDLGDPTAIPVPGQGQSAWPNSSRVQP